jgi:hypothetical protein
MDSADPQLRMLFDYTIFHIGLYTSLVSAVFALTTFGDKHPRIKKRAWLLKVTVISFLLAGAAGGAIASNIPEYKTFDCYSSAGLTVFRYLGPFHYSVLAHIEHGAFWVGILFAVTGFLLPEECPLWLKSICHRFMCLRKRA